MKTKKTFLFIAISLIILVTVLIAATRISSKDSTKELYDQWYNQQNIWLSDTPLKDGYEDVEFESRGRAYGWGWGYVGNSLIDMYRATGDKKYLELFIPQAEYIFTQTDEKLGVESFTDSGLSLQAWSDGGHYSKSGEYNYIYSAQTGMIVLPVLRFVDVVNEYELKQYKDVAEKFLLASGQALEVHNSDKMWKDISENEGFYLGHPYGEGEVVEANKIGIPNRLSIYLAAAGMYDKLSGNTIYTDKIEKSLYYFKNTLFQYDKDYDSYYWDYWQEQQEDEETWEDISHACLTVYGLFILHDEADFNVLTDDDFEKLTNIVHKSIDNSSDVPKVSKFIHKRSDEEETYYSLDENKYYDSILRWSFLGIYDDEIFSELDVVFEEVYKDRDNPPESTLQTRLSQVASYLYAKERVSN